MQDLPLKLPGHIIVQNEIDDLFDDLGGILLNTANDAVGKRDVCHIALSGGSTPEPSPDPKLTKFIRTRNT